MTFMSSGLTVRTKYDSVREFIQKHKARFEPNVLIEANHLSRILEIQGGNEISQYCIGVISSRLATIHYSLIQDISVEDTDEYLIERAVILALAIRMMLEVNDVGKNLDEDARQYGETVLLGNPDITARVKGYIEQPWNSREFQEVQYEWFENSDRDRRQGYIEL